MANRFADMFDVLDNDGATATPAETAQGIIEEIETKASESLDAQTSKQPKARKPKRSNASTPEHSNISTSQHLESQTYKLPSAPTSEHLNGQTSQHPDAPTSQSKSKSPDYQRTTVYLPKAVHFQLKIAAMGEGREMSDVIEDLVTNWLKSRSNI